MNRIESASKSIPIFEKIEAPTKVEAPPTKVYWLLSLFIITIPFVLWYLDAQAAALESALNSGNLKEAKRRVERGGWIFYDVTKEKLKTLHTNQQIASIKFIAKLITFEKDKPDGGSNKSLAFIEARDTSFLDKGFQNTLIQILPFAEFRKTVFNGPAVNYSWWNDCYLTNRKRQFA